MINLPAIARSRAIAVGSHAKPKILDLKLVDVSHLFENDPSPSWVAATLAKITKD